MKNSQNITAINGLGYQMDTINETHDLLDGKPIINHYGEPLHHLNGLMKAKQIKLSDEQKDFSGLKTNWAYQIA